MMMPIMFMHVSNTNQTSRPHRFCTL